MTDCVSMNLQSLQFYLPVLKPECIGKSLSLVKLKDFTIATEVASE